MASRRVNKVILVGYLRKDPSVRFLPNGEPVADIVVATLDRWRDPSGQRKQRAKSHHVVCFRGLARIAGGFMRKGSKVYIAGSLRFRKWPREGIDQYTTEIVADEMQILDQS